MIKLLALILGLNASFVFAQKTVNQKPILLKVKAKTQTISMEYENDILYFDKSVLLPLIQEIANEDKHPVYHQMIVYLNNSPNEIALKQKDSVHFNNIGERNLHKVLIELAPEMRKQDLASAMDKKTKSFSIPKTKEQTVSMEYALETLYFSKTALISALTKKSQADKINIYNPVINYINTSAKPILFIYNETTNLTSNVEKKLHEIILQVAPKTLAEGKAADKVKKTGAFNRQIFVNHCGNNNEKKIITERKGRVIFDCF